MFRFDDRPRTTKKRAAYLLPVLAAGTMGALIAPGIGTAQAVAPARFSGQYSVHEIITESNFYNDPVGLELTAVEPTPTTSPPDSPTMSPTPTGTDTPTSSPAPPAADAATLVVRPTGQEAYELTDLLVSSLLAPDRSRPSEIYAAAEEDQPIFALSATANRPRPGLRPLTLRGDLVFEKDGNLVIAGVNGHWDPETETFTGSFHGKYRTEVNEKLKTIVLSGTFDLTLPADDGEGEPGHPGHDTSRLAPVPQRAGSGL